MQSGTEEDSAEARARTRVTRMGRAVVVAFALLLVRTAWLQIARAQHYHRLGDEALWRTVEVKPRRGAIRDARGRVLAGNRASYDVYALPGVLAGGGSGYARLVAALGASGEQAEQLRERLASARGEVLVRRDADPETLAALDRVGRIPGVSVREGWAREYPFGSLGAHALGFLNEVSRDDLLAPGGEAYRVGDRVGRAGLERAWEHVLRGVPGHARVRREAWRYGADATAGSWRMDATPGFDLGTTLDAGLMQTLDAEFTRRGIRRGAAAAVDVRDGRVLALYARPATDPNAYARGLSLAAYQSIAADPDRPLLDRAVGEALPPGSLFKVLTALAALEHGVPASAEVHCGGRFVLGRWTYACWQPHGHGALDLRDALARSCNTYFYEQGLTVGFSALAREASAFGFGQLTGVGLEQEVPGAIQDEAWRARHPSLRFTMDSAVGQGDARATPLQVALAYAAIANGGTLYEPRLVDRILTPQGEIVRALPPVVRRRIDASPTDLAAVRDGLLGAVEDPQGTAHAAHDPDPNGVLIAGKTAHGTADCDARGRCAIRATWFAAFAPALNPQVALVVVIEDGDDSNDAVPIVRAAVDAYLGKSAEGGGP